MPTLKDVVQIIERLKLNPDKIPISKGLYVEIIKKAKDMSFSELLKKKTD